MDEKPIQVQLGAAAAVGETGGRLKGCTWKRGYGYGTLGVVMLLTEVVFSFTIIYQYCWKTARNRWLDHLLLSYLYLIYHDLPVFRFREHFPFISHGFPGSRSVHQICGVAPWRGVVPGRRCLPVVEAGLEDADAVWGRGKLRAAAAVLIRKKQRFSPWVSIFWGIPRCFFEWNILI